jgi:hypothetical protein
LPKLVVLGCPAALVIVLISHLDARQHAAVSADADAFIRMNETADRVAERLHLVAAHVGTGGNMGMLSKRN